MNTQQLELIIATNYFNHRIQTIIPNISWGLNLDYEADMVILNKSDYLYEVELKISLSDLKADEKKRNNHNSNLFRKLFFAIPDYLESNQDLIPEKAGIIVATQHNYTKLIRAPKLNKNAHAISLGDKIHLLELGCMRIYNLKKKLYKLRSKL